MKYQEQTITDPTRAELGNAEEYEIHRGYRPFILGLIREVEFMTRDKIKTHNCLFRGVYLIKVMDLFAEELKGAHMVTARWRSRVLNPLLQRQLRGVSDHEPEAVRNEVGNTLEASAAFYLTHDPLNTALTGKLRRNILYIWHVRLSLDFLGYKYVEGSAEIAIENSQALLDNRGLYADEEFDEDKLYSFERNVIKAENIERLYDELLGWVSGLEPTYHTNLIYHTIWFQPDEDGGPLTPAPPTDPPVPDEPATPTNPPVPDEPATPTDPPVPDEPAPSSNLLQNPPAGEDDPPTLAKQGGQGLSNPNEGSPSNPGGADPMICE